MNGYFYWFGLVMNVLMGLAFLVSVGLSIHQWFLDLKEDRYFNGKRKNGEMYDKSEGRNTVSNRTTE